MKYEDLISGRKKLYSEYREKVNLLNRHYAFSNNTIKEGDIIEDHIGKIKVESIGCHIGIGDIPECTYTGIELLKSGKPSKKEKTRTVYQSNLLTTPST